MPARIIKCQTCPTYFTTPWKTRKYCSICQVIRDYEVCHFGKKPKTCEMCEREFYPPRSHWPMCADCTEPVEQPSRHEPCNRCGKCFRKAPGLKLTCTHCIQESAQVRKEYVQHLYQLREEVIANPPEPPAEYLAQQHSDPAPPPPPIAQPTAPIG